jgi:hypothetical protein
MTEASGQAQGARSLTPARTTAPRDNAREARISRGDEIVDQ